MKKYIVLLLIVGTVLFAGSQEPVVKSVESGTNLTEIPFGQARLYGGTSGVCYVASNAEYKNKKWYRLTAGLASVIDQSAGVVTVKRAVTGAAGSQITWVTLFSSSATSTFNIQGLPTTSNGLSTGDLWNSSGTLKIN